MDLKQHYPHMCIQAVRAKSCPEIGIVLGKAIEAMSIGLKKEPRLQALLAARTEMECRILDQAGFKRESHPMDDWWDYRGTAPASEMIISLEQVGLQRPNELDTLVEVRVRERATGEDVWIPRWHLVYKPYPYLDSSREGAELLLMKAAYEITEMSATNRRQFMDALMHALDVADDGWEYAYIEMNDETEHAMANAYTSMLGSSIRWNSAVRYLLWQPCAESEAESIRERRRQRPCRGVYWGNLFGPEILARLGGKDAFIAEFEAAREQTGSDGAWLREMRNGGVFFTLSGELLDCWHVTASPLISFSPALRMGVWLWDRLQNAGLLL